MPVGVSIAPVKMIGLPIASPDGIPVGTIGPISKGDPTVSPDAIPLGVSAMLPERSTLRATVLPSNVPGVFARKTFLATSPV